MFGLVFTAGRSRLARRHHRIESARPIDPWRATIIQAENWAEYLGVEKAVLGAAHATALSVFFSCRCTLPVGAPKTPPTGRAEKKQQLREAYKPVKAKGAKPRFRLQGETRTLCVAGKYELYNT
ncbi:hypothetical protein Bbelb_047180 [Branchiostoma belcheri]|nr:hypothetical protein Bbelb_047180 [Branchiostoma belcheri]